MEVNEITEIFQGLLTRVEAVGLTIGIDLLGLAQTMASEFKEMGLDIVHAAETGQVQ